MTITFDATVGSPSANSYIDVATADDVMPLIVSKVRSDAWTALSDAVKQNFLMRAVKMMEAYIDFDGVRVLWDQPIMWPRDWVYGPDRHNAYAATEIPREVQEAQALMALNLSEGFDQADSSAAPLERLQISTLRMQFASSRSARGSLLLPPEVIEKLRGFGKYVGASGMARSVSMERG